VDVVFVGDSLAFIGFRESAFYSAEFRGASSLQVMCGVARFMCL
jgi:hypothetical protein